MRYFMHYASHKIFPSPQYAHNYKKLVTGLFLFCSTFYLSLHKKSLTIFVFFRYTNHSHTTKNGHTMTTNNRKTNAVSQLDYLPYNVHVRLVQCQTTKDDLSILLDTKWKWAQDTGCYNGYIKEDILADILNLLDSNGLGNVTELTMDEWKNLIK